MAQQTATTATDLNSVLWQSLTNELAQVFDAHFVCAAVAGQIARHTQTQTVVGISDPQREFFDVWIAEVDGRIKQQRWAADKASLAPIIAADGTIHQQKFDQQVAELIQSELWLLPHDSILGIALPFPTTFQPVSLPGVICLIDPSDACPLDGTALEQLATLVTVFLDRAYLRHKVDRQEIEFAVISDISHTLTSSLSLENVFAQLTGTVRRTLNVESLSVGLTEPTTGDIIFVDLLMGPLFKNLPTIRLQQGQGVAGWVAEHREPVIINDTYSDTRFYSRVDRQSGFQTHSMICIPLAVEENTIGVLQAINRKQGDFTNHDLRLLQAIGGPLAAAIENARLHTDVLAEKRRIETIFTNMSEGMLTVNAERFITHANDAMGALLLRKPQKLVGKRIEDVIHIHGGDLSQFVNHIMNATDEYPQITGDLLQKGDAQIPVLISGASINDDEGKINEIIFEFSDLTQIREIERMRDDLYDGIVHELRTPLATILMYARLLREGKARDEAKAERFLGVIERESDRLQKMVRQMLWLSKQEAREFHRSAEPIVLNPLFDEMLPALADRATEKGLTFFQRIEPDLPAVMGNLDTMHLIFKNLIENAIKFTFSGAVRVRAFLQDETVQVQIKDEGIGIPQQALPNLFKRFYRTQTAVERGIAGTGLGLYMVKENLKYYNGSIEVKSTEGEGTTFTVILPIVQGLG